MFNPNPTIGLNQYGTSGFNPYSQYMQGYPQTSTMTGLNAANFNIPSNQFNTNIGSTTTATTQPETMNYQGLPLNVQPVTSSQFQQLNTQPFTPQLGQQLGLNNLVTQQQQQPLLGSNIGLQAGRM